MRAKQISCTFRLTGAWVRTDKKIAIVLLLSVLALFLFPLSFGSFQSVNGPTTTVKVRTPLMPPVLQVIALALLMPALFLFTQTYRFRISIADPEYPATPIRELDCSFRC